MSSKVQKRDNSESLSSKDLRHEGILAVKPLCRVRRGHDLRELVSRIPKDYKPEEEVDWGPAVGREAW